MLPAVVSVTVLVTPLALRAWEFSHSCLPGSAWGNSRRALDFLVAFRRSLLHSHG